MSDGARLFADLAGAWHHTIGQRGLWTVLTQLEVFTSGVLTPPLSVVAQDVSRDYIQIKKIVGLGPVKADISTSPYGNIDGEFITDTGVKGRNIVLTLGLNPDWHTHTYSSLRQILYRYFTPKTEVTLKFGSTDLPDVTVTGVVETMDPPLFEEDPEYVVSIVCEESYFKAIEPTILTGVTTSFTAPEPLIFENEGTAEVGFVFEIVYPEAALDIFLNWPKSDIRIANYAEPFQLLIARDVEFRPDSTYRVSTVDKQRFARQVFTEVDFLNAMPTIDRYSAWTQFRANTNELSISASIPGLDWKITYYALYGGL